MKKAIIIIFKIILAIVFFVPIYFAYHHVPNINKSKLNTEIEKWKKCRIVQEKYNDALSKLPNQSSIPQTTKTFKEFQMVEDILIKNECLEKTYTDQSPDCCFVLFENEIFCAIHADSTGIKQNTETVQRSLKQISTNLTIETITYLIGYLLLLISIFL